MKRWRLLRALAIAVAVSFVAYALIPKPSLTGDPSWSVAVTDRNGALLRLALADDERYRLATRLPDIAASARAATLLYEDRYFRRHPGVNPVALIRASWTTFIQGDRAMGASTITMQLVRLRDGLNTRTVSGKLRQIARAIQLERHFSKDEILEAYLNLAPYGGNIEGIGTAARVYFDKPAAELTLAESLALAVVAQNPVGRNPATPAGYREMLRARERLTAQWRARYEVSAVDQARLGLPLAVRPISALPFEAPHSVNDALRVAPPGTEVLALDRNLQKLLETEIETYTARLSAKGIRNASAMIVDTETREVLATVGSANFHSDALHGQVNGTRARRSPGSTLKPFLYGLALDQGIIHPASLLLDAPRRYAAYAPENFDRGFSGPIRARDALIYSRNVPAIELLTQVGHERFHAFLERGGVADQRSADYYGLAMILGGNELTMRELVALYAMLANGGQYQPLRDYLNQTDASEAPVALLSPEASFLVLDMLADNPRPDRLALIDQPATGLPWKTGTSYGFRDAWSIGLVGHLAVAVWVGNFDGSANPAFVGREAAAPLFFAVADRLRSERAEARVALPRPGRALNVKKVAICSATGELPGRYCPRTTPSWFIPGVSPIAVANVFRAIDIDTRSGLRVCNPDKATTEKNVFEFWPSEIQRLYQSAGIAIKKPPNWSAECKPSEHATLAGGPAIRSPTSGVDYVAADGSVSVQLAASADAEVAALYWFDGDRFLGEATPKTVLSWRASPGEHQLHVIDDLGRSATQSLRVVTAL